MKQNLILLILVLLPMILAFVTYFLGKKKDLWMVNAVMISGVVEFILMLVAAFGFGQTDLYIPKVCGMGIHFTMDGFRSVYGLIASFMWMMTLLFSKEYMAHETNTGRYYFFQLMTLSATMGVFLSADLFTTFIFFEIMSFTSYVWVVQEETKEAIKAAETYLAVAVFGGLVTLMGLFLLNHMLGTLEMEQLLNAAKECENKSGLYIAGACTVIGFLAKAGVFPLHIWLPKAHPVAPSPASALLSGILTKSGIFGVLVVSCNVFCHDERWGILLVSLGMLTMFGGALLAVCSINLKRTLACSSMSQIGFILIGIGMQCILGEENGLAVRGTFLHMLNHSLIKLVLFMIAGTVVVNVEKLNLNDIKGYGRKKPFLHVTFLIGALGIAGVPMFNGYLSKTLLHESIIEGVMHLQSHGSDAAGFLQMVEWIFLLSGGMTLAYMTKLYVAIFVQENNSVVTQRKYDENKEYLSLLSGIAIGTSAGIVFVIGAFPHLITDKIADLGHGFMQFYGEVHPVSYFSLTNLKGAVISIIIGVTLYLLSCVCMTKREDGVRVYKDVWPKWFDVEELFYRPVLLKILPFICGVACRALDSIVDTLILFLRKTIYRDAKIPHEPEEGTVFTNFVGMILDSCRNIRRKISRKQECGDTISYSHRIALWREKVLETNTIIRRSLSYGLLLFYVGLVFTLVYLLYLSKYL